MKRLIAAAEKGDANSQFNLGVMYDNGLDDNNRPNGGNRQKALKWLLEAAEQGLARAQLKLAEIYADRWAAEPDHEKACMWFLVAAAASTGIHRQQAQSGFARVSAQLSSAQVVMARRMAGDWTPKQAVAALAASLPMSL